MKKEQTFEMKKIIKKNNGITLIALVITIIVLLILAGVTIATLTGENGILTRASDASEQTELADEREKVELATIGALAKENGGEISQTSLEEELGKYFENGKYAVEPGTNEDGTEGYIVTITENDEQGRTYFVDKNGNVEDYIVREPAEPTEGTGTNFNMSYGVIEVEFLDGTSYNATTTPNHPVLKEGMTAITYNESTGETTNVSNSSGTDWYSYVSGYYTGSSDLTNGSLFANGISDAYSTAYSGTTASSAYKYGDATYETNGWNSDDAYFVDWYYPFFYRGGCYDDTSNAGVFDFYSGYGNEKREFSFRVSLAVQ